MPKSRPMKRRNKVLPRKAKHKKIVQENSWRNNLRFACLCVMLYIES